MKKLIVFSMLFGIIFFSCKKKDVVETSDNPNAAFINSKGCIECDKYAIGDIFTIDGVTYTVADREILDSALASGEDLSKYCTSKVTNMDEMFSEDKSFNQDISNWDVSNVTEVDGIFNGATSFNQDIGNWDVSNVTRMGWVFEDATTFNQDLTQWCVSKITSIPRDFSKESGLTPENHPVWGTCPP